MKVYRAALVGCSRMGAFLDNEARGLPFVTLPYSHAAGYEAVERTQLVALSDLRPDVLALAGERYGVGAAHRYLDYREMIRREQPDILSIATQPEGRAEIVQFACAHGVRAIYCEKPLAASLAETEQIVQAVEAHGVHFNLGTLRRWAEGNALIRQYVESRELGGLKALISYASSALFNMGSHYLDLLLYLNHDRPVAWVQGTLLNPVLDGDTLREDPACEAMLQFADGVNAYLLHTARTAEFEAVFESGSIANLNNGLDWEIRRRPSPKDLFVREELPRFPARSRTVACIEDLVQALDTGGPTRGNVRVARASSELIFAIIESHRRGGARVPLPLADSRTRLVRNVQAKPVQAR